MRTLPLLAGAVLALGMFSAVPARAHGGDARIWVSFGDVAFSAGRPYHRLHHYPLQVVHDVGGPHYFYYGAPAPVYYVPRPVVIHGHGPGRHHGGPRHYRPAPPPPPRPGYHRHRPGY